MRLPKWAIPEKICTSPMEEMENDPSLRTSQDSRTSPDSKAQNYTPPSDIDYFKRFNKSRQRQSNILNFCNFDKLSVTSLGASALRHVFTASCSNTVLKVNRMKVNHSKVNKHSVLRLSNILIGFEVFAPRMSCFNMRTSSKDNRSHDLLTLK